MRIIAGEWRGRPLRTAAGAATRPTADRVRESLFSMLVSRIGPFKGLRVADLFAGSGALGFEALSRGAAFACFVENDAAAAAAIESNGAALGAGARMRIVRGSALALQRSEPFDLIFADPPYSPGSGSAAVRATADAGWLAPGGWIALESARGDRLDPGPFSVEAERDVARARLTFLRAPSSPTS